MADEAPRCGVVWCGPREPSLPTFLCASDLLFFFFFFPTREGGEEDRVLRARRKAGRGGRASGAPARGFWTRNTRPRTATHGPLEPKTTAPPSLGMLARMHGRTHDTHPPRPLPFRSGRVDLCLPLHVLFVLTFFSVFETQPTNTSSFFSHNNRDQGTKKGKSGKSYTTTQRKDEPRVRLPVQAAADRRQRRGKVVPPAALR